MTDTKALRGLLCKSIKRLIPEDPFGQIVVIWIGLLLAMGGSALLGCILREALEPKQ